MDRRTDGGSGWLVGRYSYIHHVFLEGRRKYVMKSLYPNLNISKGVVGDGGGGGGE